jgi:hypothetical protein
MTKNMTMTKDEKLPESKVRYVVPATIVHSDEVIEAHWKRLQEIIANYGKVSLRFEVRYWDPEKHNNTTFPGTINAHFHDVEMAMAVMERVRAMVVKGQRVEE